MRTVKDIETVEVKVSSSDLFEDKWLNTQLLSSKLGVIEQSGNMKYKSLRSKLYNNTAGKKYNIKEFAGMKFIDIEQPMVEGTVASLVLKFRKEA